MTSRFSLYTRTGDEGETFLGEKQRVSKSNPGIDVYGNLDEASAFIGLASNFIEEAEVRSRLYSIQDDLLALGGVLYGVHSGKKADYAGWEDKIRELEAALDSMSSGKTRITGFQRQGMGWANGYLHVARTVVRRSERALARMREDVVFPVFVSSYINRLSDFLFALACHVAEDETGSAAVVGGKPIQR